jgi:hypothetical protein
MKRGFDIKQELSGKIYDILDAIQSKIRTFIEEFLRETIDIYNRMGLYLIGPGYCCITLDNWYNLAHQLTRKVIDGFLSVPKRKISD